MYQRLILFAIAAFLLSVKADGRFPLPETLSESTFQFLLLPYTLLFILVIGLFFRKEEFLSRALPVRLREIAATHPISLIQLASSVCILFLTFVLIIFFWQARKYSQFGYHLNGPALIVFYAISVIQLLRMALQRRGHLQFLVSATAIFAGIYLLSIQWFPLHPGRSDMLPLIEAAGKRFLAGASPYTVYSLPHSVPLTYLPGMWFAYLPAVTLGFDLRLVHLFAILCTVFLLYAGTAQDRREIAASFCGLFLLIPYLLYRHEIYLGILWFALSLVYFFENRNSPIWAGFCLGLAASVSQLAWVLVPLLFLTMYRRSGWKIAMLGLIVCGAVLSCMVLPFVIQSPQGFYEGIFGHWKDTFNATTLNFSYFTASIFTPQSLKYFQIVLIAAICWIAGRNALLPHRTYEFMTYALLFFVLLNPVIWVYFYLTLFVLMTFDVSRNHGVIA